MANDYSERYPNEAKKSLSSIISLLMKHALLSSNFCSALDLQL